MKALNKFVLTMGKLQLPLCCYKVKDNTTSVRASEVAKINGKIFKVQRKPFYVNEAGESVDIDKTQILKQYARDDGELALFTKEEQAQLLKKGSSREWVANTVVDKKKFSELSFQKDGIIAMVELVKDKEILNKMHLKFFAQLKEGLQDKVIVTQVLYKNVEYPVAISNSGDKLLVRFLHYEDEIRKIEGQMLPTLSDKEKQQAKTFIMNFYNPNFDIKKFKNNTEKKVMEIINNRGTEVKEVKVEDMISAEENPFA